MHDDLDIPKFLRIPQAVRNASWKGKRPRSTREMSFSRKHVEPADVRAFRLEQEKKRKAKQAEVFKMLAQRRAEKKAKTLQ